MSTLLLASGSEIRRRLLRNAGVEFDVAPARIDESAIRESLAAAGADARDMADALADAKARRVAQRSPGAIVVGCDQILAIRGEILGKPEGPEAARGQLARLVGHVHHLHSAAVVYDDGRPVWRHIGTVRMHMRRPSDDYLDAYVDRNWHSIRDSVGGYKLEEEGIRLFSRIEGDYFTVLGLPLIELLGYLTLRGVLPG